jgi:hypothetical protein
MELPAAAREPDPGGRPAPVPGPAGGCERRWTRWARWLVALQLALLLHGAWRVGPTYDEHFYVAAGYAYWQDGEFALNREHPPLLKLLAGAPLLLLPGVHFGDAWQDELNYPVAFFYQRNGEHLDRNLFAARVPFCLLTALLTWVVFRVGARRFGPRGGFVSAALLGLNPNVLAHGRLAALDAGTMVFVFLAAVAFLEALERPTATRRLWSGVAFGLAQAAKFTSLLLVPLVFAAALLAAVRQRSLRPLVTLALTIGVGLTVFAATYGFEARAANEAWNVPAYTVSKPAPALDPEVLAAALGGELAASGWSAARLAEVRARLGAARTPEALGQVFAELLAQGEPAGAPDGAARALLAVAAGPGELRRRAFEAVLESPAVSPEVALRVLPVLADRELLARGAEPLAGEEGLARWREWYGAARYDDWDAQLFTQAPIERLTRGLLGDTRPIPLFTALRGVDYQLHHGQYGHATYYRGRTLVPGPDFAEGNPYPEYYSVVLWLKNPVAFLLACAGGLGLAFVFGRRGAALPSTAPPWTVLELLTFVGFPALCFWLFSTGNALMGVRYLLPVFPFLALLAGRLEGFVPRLGVGLALVAAAESLWIHPHQLMYFNATIGGPRHGPEITVVSDDWGQDVRELGRFHARHREAIAAAGGLYYVPYSTADLAVFGLEEVQPVEKPVRGIVAVNAVHYYRESNVYGWLREFEPFLRLGWSVWLYDTREGPPGRDPGWR